MTFIATLQKKNKSVYIGLIAILATMLFLGYFPALDAFSSLLTPPVALLTGLIFALLFGQAYPTFNKKTSKYLLQYSVVGLGFGMNIEQSLASGSAGMAFTIVSVVGTMLLGMLIGYKILKIDRDTSYLVSAGTAICGGSAIAAVGPVLKANDAAMSVSLGTVFILNAIALFIFPTIGRWLYMTDVQFGTWAAIAIHDTSSVVGAGQAFSDAALEIATTVKLTRALWIIPLALVTSFAFKGSGKKIAIPVFIFFFILAIVFNTYVLSNPAIWGSWGVATGGFISGVAKKCLTLTLFFIGASLSRDVIRQVGIKPLMQGVLLWILISVGSLAYIMLS